MLRDLINQLKAGAYGLGEGASLGLAPHIAAAVSSVVEPSLPPEYRDTRPFSERYRDAYGRVRGYSTEAKEASPRLAKAAEVVGSLAPMLIAPGATLSQTAIRGAIPGAVSGLTSADQPIELTKEEALRTTLGGLLGGGAAAAARGVTSAARLASEGSEFTGVLQQVGAAQERVKAAKQTIKNANVGIKKIDRQISNIVAEQKVGKAQVFDEANELVAAVMRANPGMSAIEASKFAARSPAFKGLVNERAVTVAALMGEKAALQSDKALAAAGRAVASATLPVLKKQVNKPLAEYTFDLGKLMLPGAGIGMLAGPELGLEPTTGALVGAALLAGPLGAQRIAQMKGDVLTSVLATKPVSGLIERGARTVAAQPLLQQGAQEAVLEFVQPTRPMMQELPPPAIPVAATPRREVQALPWEENMTEAQAPAEAPKTTGAAPRAARIVIEGNPWD